MLDLPDLVQTYGYDCGANALQTVLAYYGIETREDAIIIEAGTNEDLGTTVAGIENVLKKYDLKFDSRSMSPDDLRKYINDGIPVFLRLQAWSEYVSAHDAALGHWVVLAGYNEKKFFFEDPSTFVRSFLDEDELVQRWHAEENGKKLINLGIAAYGKKPIFNSKSVVHMD